MQYGQELDTVDHEKAIDSKDLKSSDKNDELLLAISEIAGEVHPDASFNITSKGLAAIGRLDKAAHRMLLALVYHAMTDDEVSKGGKALKLDFLSDGVRTNFVNSKGDIVLQYQQRFRGLRTLVDEGFILPNAPTADEEKISLRQTFHINPEYGSIYHPDFRTTKS